MEKIRLKSVVENSLKEKRAWFILAFQALIVACSFWGSFLLRFDFDVPNPFGAIFWTLLPIILIIKLVTFRLMGLARGWWRYVSLSDVIDIFKANVTASLVFLLYVVFVRGVAGFPRSVLLVDGGLCFLLMGGVRFLTRAFRENYLTIPGRNANIAKKVLIIGAGDAGQAIAREVRQNAALEKRVVGYVDDDSAKRKQRFQGIPVLGSLDDVDKICLREEIKEIIIAIPSATRKELSGILKRCAQAGVEAKILPSMGDLIDGKVSVKLLRDVDVNELLGREPVRLDAEEIANYLTGKAVLVTGAAGSIGSELCRQVARFSPASLVLLDNSESPLFQIERELNYQFPNLSIKGVLGDIRNRARVSGVFEKFNPDIVFHAAAYKHVPIMEENPAEAADNNTRGTIVVADAARDFRIESFVLISTDKAVKPSSVMGASKRAAELYLQGLSTTGNTRFVTVRFGNVLDSAGSVVPIFMDQIKKGEPIKVTHPEITRYFMTIPEAAQLVLQAANMGTNGGIYVLDMGEPVRILNLAEQVIRLSGLKPHEDVEIIYTGLRPGEKLVEELFRPDEGVCNTSHEKIMVANTTTPDWETLQQQMEALYQATRKIDADRVKAVLEEIVPEYQPFSLLAKEGFRN